MALQMKDSGEVSDSWNAVPSVLATIAWLAVTLLLLHGTISEFQRLVHFFRLTSSFPASLPIALWVATFFALALTLRKGFYHHFLPAAIIIVSCIVRGIWIDTFDSHQISDFTWYYYCGTAIAEGNPLLCIDPVIWKRSIVNTAPLFHLFTPSLAKLELFNLALFAVTSLVFFATGARLYGRRIATLALFVFVSWPDYFYPITLASHDITGVFWLSLFFLVACNFYARLAEEGPGSSLIGWAFLTGVILTFLDFSRSYHFTAAVAMLFISGIYAYRAMTTAASRADYRRAGLVLALGFAIPFLVYLASANLLWRAAPSEFPTYPPRSVSNAAYITAVDIYSSNQWADMASWEYSKFPLLAEVDNTEFAIGKFLNEWTHDPQESFAHILRKNAMLSRSDGNFAFTRMNPAASGNFHEDINVFDGEVKRTNDLDEKSQLFAISFFGSLILLFSWARVTLLPWLPFNRAEWPIIYFSLFSYASLLFLGEAQPRYTLFLMFPFSLWTSYILLAEKSDYRNARGGSKRLAAAIIFGFLSLVVLVGGSYLFQRYHSDFLDTTDAEMLSESEATELAEGSSKTWIPAVVDSHFNRISLSYPANVDIAAGTVLGAKFVDGGRGSSLEFFLTTLPKRFRLYYEIDDRVLPWEEFGIFYCVYLNNEKLRCGRVSDFSTEFLEVDDGHYENQGDTEIKLVVWNERKIEAGELPDEPLTSLDYLRSVDRRQ